MEYAMKILNQVNAWWDNLSQKYKTAGWAAAVGAALLLGALDITWFGFIFFTGLVAARLWYVWSKPQA